MVDHSRDTTSVRHICTTYLLVQHSVSLTLSNKNKEVVGETTVLQQQCYTVWPQSNVTDFDFTREMTVRQFNKSDGKIWKISSAWYAIPKVKILHNFVCF